MLHNRTGRYRGAVVKCSTIARGEDDVHLLPHRRSRNCSLNRRAGHLRTLLSGLGMTMGPARTRTSRPEGRNIRGRLWMYTQSRGGQMQDVVVGGRCRHVPLRLQEVLGRHSSDKPKEWKGEQKQHTLEPKRSEVKLQPTPHPNR